MDSWNLPELCISIATITKHKIRSSSSWTHIFFTKELNKNYMPSVIICTIIQNPSYTSPILIWLVFIYFLFCLYVWRLMTVCLSVFYPCMHLIPIRFWMYGKNVCNVIKCSMGVFKNVSYIKRILKIYMKIDQFYRTSIRDNIIGITWIR